MTATRTTAYLGIREALHDVTPAELLKLHGILQDRIKTTRFPALLVDVTDMDAIDARIERLAERRDAAVGKEAVRIQKMIDEAEDEKEVEYRLMCPVCRECVEPADLVAVDIAERETPADSFDDERGLDNGEVEFNYDSGTDFEGFYYKHGYHAVDLPDGWTER